MNYQFSLEYANGAVSHQVKTLCRKDIEAHLHRVVSDEEIMRMANRIVMTYGCRTILRKSTSVSVSDILESIKWPSVGAPAKVNKPTTATLYMPEKVKEWLKEQGGGKASPGFRKLVELANIPELEDAWVEKNK